MAELLRLYFLLFYAVGLVVLLAKTVHMLSARASVESRASARRTGRFVPRPSTPAG